MQWVSVDQRVNSWGHCVLTFLYGRPVRFYEWPIVIISVIVMSLKLVVKYAGKR